jgi:hypothetical protein
MEDRTSRKRRMRTMRRRGTRSGRRGTRTVQSCMTRGWRVTGLLQDHHPHVELGLATLFALL